MPHTLLNGLQEIPTPPDYPFDRKTPFSKYEQRYSLYPISLSQFSIGETDLSAQLTDVCMKTPDGPGNELVVGQ
jgi:hypothetical protein